MLEHDLAVFCICVHTWKSVSGCVFVQMSMYVPVCTWEPCVWECWGVDVGQLPNPSDEKPCDLLSQKRTEEAS